MSKTGLIDVSAATKFLKIFAENSNITVEFIPGLKVPTASPKGLIKVPPPSIESLDEWLWHVHHEVSHCFPEHKYHFEAFAKCTSSKDIMNIIVDNIAEYFEYNRYQGRANILSKGRYEFFKKHPDFFQNYKTPQEKLLFAVVLWDNKNRCSWMNYPFDNFTFDISDFTEEMSHFDSISLTSLIRNQKSISDLDNIVEKILEFLDKQKSEQDDSDKQEQDEENKGEQDSTNDDGKSTKATVNQSIPTKPSDNFDDNVSEETKATVSELLMSDDSHIQFDEGTYIPIKQLSYLPLARYINDREKSQITILTSNSKISKNIKKYLQTFIQTSYQYGMKSGKLASRSIYKTAHGGTTIFKNKVNTRVKLDTAITLLVDCSASMNKSIYSNSGKFRVSAIAFSSVVLIADTLKSLGINHEVLGFTERKINIRDINGGGIYMIEFKNFNQNSSKTKMIDNLSKCPTKGNNADAESILETASRLSKRKEQKKIMIVLSDGNPNAYFNSPKNVAHAYVKTVCQHIENDTPIDLIGIGIATKTVESFYSNSIVVNDISKLDVVLMKLLRDKIL